MPKFWRAVYYYMNWDYPDILTTEKIKRQRHLVMRQIRESNIKLKPVNLIKSVDYIQQIMNNIEEQRKMLQPFLYDDVESCEDTESEKDEVDITEYN